MRRKISLYIGGLPVDLDDQSFILFNYAMDDLSNPAIVKNSFSQQITLKGTANNNLVFGGMFRPDRRVEVGGFNPSQKTPFTIYNEMNEILESGYVKLDSIDRNGADIQYKVTLYGGLGSFFYALSYDENGEKRTLADLDYLGTGSPETELDFTINAASVLDAWARLDEDTTKAEMWDVINFAPAYNGIPDGDFSPDKGLIVPSDSGLQAPITGADGKVYDVNAGYALVNLAQAHDEWAVKDLRSYLQRPVLSMAAFWKAICDPANNGGYEVDADVISWDGIGRYALTWLTLPMIPSIGTNREETGDLSVTMSTSATSGNDIGRYDISGSVPSGTMVTANLSCKVIVSVPSAPAVENVLFNSPTTELVGNRYYFKGNILFLQSVAYAADDTMVGGSRIKVIGAVGTGEEMAAACGFTPAWSEEYDTMNNMAFDRVVDGYESRDEIAFQVKAQDVAYYKVKMWVYGCSGSRKATSRWSFDFSGDGSTSTPVMYKNYNTSYASVSAKITEFGTTANSVKYTSSESLRSGAVVTKAMLLSSTNTPADYMLSFCKMFGLYFTYDNSTKKVTILRRNDLYQDETIDLTKRVDTSKGITIRPLVFDAKWYDFILEGVGGAFYDEYLSTEGREYGIQRVNTGFDFNADAVNLMESVVFKNAVTILDRSAYYNYIFNGGDFIPSPFLDKGNTYTLWSPDGDTLDTDISCPPISASLTSYNTDFLGYDINEARKCEFRNSENKPVDGAGVLVFHEGWNRYDYFKVTDDLPAMDVLNEGKPCWLLGAGDDGVDAPYVPIFSRYTFGHGYKVSESLDFGVPGQLDIPGVDYDDTCTIYRKAWSAYLADRYDVNTKVMTCRVNFGGIRVGQDLLRKFYFYDNSLWVLNSIKNYSLTTYDPVECEFVQVQDKDNYLNGQDY